jgi:hypothetical protein
MEFHLATMSTFFPSTGSEADWNAAYYRLEDYFRSLRIVNKVHQSQIILHILNRAAARHVKDPARNPTTLAMEEARAAMDEWFENILGTRERIAAAGLISMLSINAAARWPMAFLTDEIPADFRREMQESEVRAGPDLQVSSMVPRPIDVGPLLDPFHFAGALEKIRSVAFFTVLIALTVLSLSIYLFLR